jgi:hypothetical protein
VLGGRVVDAAGEADAGAEVRAAVAPPAGMTGL